MADEWSDFLTEEQLNALPIGTKLLITWSGGNGPHVYVLDRERGVNYAEMPDDSFGMKKVRGYNPIVDPGSERYDTRVQARRG